MAARDQAELLILIDKHFIVWAISHPQKTNQLTNKQTNQWNKHLGLKMSWEFHCNKGATSVLCSFSPKKTDQYKKTLVSVVTDTDSINSLP